MKYEIKIKQEMDTKYQLLINGQKIGPFEEPVIHQMLETGLITCDTPIFSENSNQHSNPKQPLWQRRGTWIEATGLALFWLLFIFGVIGNADRPQSIKTNPMSDAVSTLLLIIFATQLVRNSIWAQTRNTPIKNNKRMRYFFLIGARAGWKWLATLPLFCFGLILLGGATPEKCGRITATYIVMLIIAWTLSIDIPYRSTKTTGPYKQYQKMFWNWRVLVVLFLIMVLVTIVVGIIQKLMNA